MALSRKISVIISLVSVALTWVFIFVTRTAALLVREVGQRLGGELILPARLLQPAGMAALILLASLGTLLLFFTQASKLSQETRLLFLSGYLSLLAIFICLVLSVLTFQIGLLLFPFAPTIAP
jgi:hypothetical protein